MAHTDPAMLAAKPARWARTRGMVKVTCSCGATVETLALMVLPPSPAGDMLPVARCWECNALIYALPCRTPRPRALDLRSRWAGRWHSVCTVTDSMAAVLACWIHPAALTVAGVILDAAARSRLAGALTVSDSAAAYTVDVRYTKAGTLAAWRLRPTIKQGVR